MSSLFSTAGGRERGKGRCQAGRGSGEKSTHAGMFVKVTLDFNHFFDIHFLVKPGGSFVSDIPPPHFSPTYKRRTTYTSEVLLVATLSNSTLHSAQIT